MASNSESKDKKSTKFTLTLLALGVIAGLILSFGIAEGVHKTGDAKFCVVCHSTMQPMVDSYYDSTHGGNNKVGFEAECNACHLPHDSLVNYLYKKVAISMHDIKVQWFGDIESIDWEKKRNHSKEYVFDSACQSCHVDLENTVMDDLKGFTAHRDYFATRTDKKCFECHRDVGHRNLGTYLKKAKQKK